MVRLAADWPTLAYVAEGLGVSTQTLSLRLKVASTLRGAFVEACSGAAKRRGRPIAALMASAPASAPPLKFHTGSRAERILAAVAAGARTYGRLLAATQLTHDAVVEEVQRQVRAGALDARMVGEELRHYLAGDVLDL